MAALRSSQHPHHIISPSLLSATVLASTAIVSNEPWFVSVYPVETLERQGGVKCREDLTERKFFNNHRSIIITINNSAQQHNITIETVANVAKKFAPGSTSLCTSLPNIVTKSSGGNVRFPYLCLDEKRYPFAHSATDIFVTPTSSHLLHRFGYHTRLVLP
ncbi:hypothetical protein [Absidia glauca]|uniref:Uncharacterized protein n=1 Tax=Absidia glauca TaxID=4829 RepID=A0A163J5A8_ABSGL|nr:hypothetical protein [Absidia glauca]